MSRIGKKPVTVPAGVKVNHDPASRTVGVEGPKGSISYTYVPQVSVEWNEAERQIVCSISPERVAEGQAKAHWGTTRSRIQGMVTGVTEGFTRRLEINGVGWNAKSQGRSLQLNVGYNQPVDLPVPKGVECEVAGDIITVSGFEKQSVGQFAADIRKTRPPEPYNGKGIKYVDEVIIRKQGKAFGA